MKLYKDEYNMVVKNISEYGCKRNDLFLTCVNSAKKKDFDSQVKKHSKNHKSLTEEFKVMQQKVNR